MYRISGFAFGQNVGLHRISYWLTWHKTRSNRQVCQYKSIRAWMSQTVVGSKSFVSTNWHSNMHRPILCNNMQKQQLKVLTLPLQSLPLQFICKLHNVVQSISTQSNATSSCTTSSKSNPLRRRRKNIWKVDEHLIKKICDLFAAITYIKIPVAYLIISYKNWCVSSEL